MCRLFGLYANKPVDVYFSFFESPRSSLAELSRENYSGWGVAWYDNDWHIYKEPLPLHSPAINREAIRRGARGRIVVSHVRHASVGGGSPENTHPWLYHGWVFAHNGTIDREVLLELLHEEHLDLEGDTDSEAFFHLIVQETEDLGDPIEGIVSAVGKVVGKGINSSTSLNFIASNGEKLYALRYAITGLDHYTLYYLERPGEVELRKLSEETHQLILTKLAQGEKAVVIASEPMSDEPNWKPIPNKNLAIIDPNLDVELIPL